MIFSSAQPLRCRPIAATSFWIRPARQLNEQVNSLYGQIMGNEGMVAYNEAKRDCENLVNYIDAIINTAMNGGDPMTVQEPSASCTGSCSTCGGCH